MSGQGFEPGSFWPRNKIADAVLACDPPLDSHEEWVASWSLRHSDAFHPGDRSTCEHCQLMIGAFGEMPLAEDIERVGSRVLRAAAKARYRKKPIPKFLRKQVFERDAYRCQHCGDWHDLCADHIIAESRGGEATLENLQTLCRACNNRKGAQ